MGDPDDIPSTVDDVVLPADDDPEIVAGLARWEAAQDVDVVEADFTQKRPRPPK